MDKLIKILMVVGTILLVSLLVALPVMWLWNWLMPHIFGLTEINFWEALGLFLLSSALFKSTNSKD